MKIDVTILVGLVAFMTFLITVITLFMRKISLQIKSFADLLKKDIDANADRLERHSEYFKVVFNKLEKTKDTMHKFDLHIASCPKSTKKMTETIKRFRDEC